MSSDQKNDYELDQRQKSHQLSYLLSSMNDFVPTELTDNPTSSPTPAPSLAPTGLYTPSPSTSPTFSTDTYNVILEESNNCAAAPLKNGSYTSAEACFDLGYCVALENTNSCDNKYHGYDCQIKACVHPADYPAGEILPNHLDKDDCNMAYSGGVPYRWCERSSEVIYGTGILVEENSGSRALLRGARN